MTQENASSLPQKIPNLGFLGALCNVAMQFEFIMGPNRRTLKKNRSALKLGPSQRTLKKLFKVSTCTNSSLNFN